MRRFSFATLITSKNDFPLATHLPFLVEQEGDKLYLLAHFAKQNEQWKQIEGTTSLVIFSEPHAYISPKNYEKELNVPTWNYISVNAYGKGHLITQQEELRILLEKTIENYESPYRQQWDRLPEKYQLGQMMGIVGFKIEVTEIQAKEKLSQNKTHGEQQTIIKKLSSSEDSNERIIAEYMNNNFLPKE